jgi:C-8 sterol isomerase
MQSPLLLPHSTTHENMSIKKTSRGQSPARSSPGINTLSIIAIVIALFSAFVYYVEHNLQSLYVFDTQQLHDLSKRAIANHGNDTRAVVAQIVGELSQGPTGPYINLNEEWVFNNAGGAMGAMYIIHASITEYLIIFGKITVCLQAQRALTRQKGTAIGTEGHTGRHTADDYFHILKGTQTAYSPAAGHYEPEIYPQGSVHHLRRGEVKQYKMDDSCFALEYARGWIPPMLGFGFADGLTSTLDFPTLWHTTRITGREMLANMAKGKL